VGLTAVLFLSHIKWLWFGIDSDLEHWSKITFLTFGAKVFVNVFSNIPTQSRLIELLTGFPSN
jgi:hypothetical protein